MNTLLACSLVAILFFIIGIACGFLWFAAVLPDVMRRHGFTDKEIARMAK